MLATTVEIQAAESKVLETERQCLYKILVDQEPSSKIDRKRCRTGKVYNELRLQ